MTLPTGRSYGVFVANTPLQAGDYLLGSAHENVTANATGTQQTATPIVGQVAHVMTAANATAPFAAVALPPWSPGFQCTVYNDTANSIQVFPALGDSSATINDGAANASITCMPNSVANFTAVVANGVLEWHCPDASSGYAAGSAIMTVSNATIAANATATQASGTAVTTLLTNVTSAATGPYSVTLPASVPGMELTVHNISAYSIYVFPNAGGTTTEKINALAANASITMTTNTSSTFTCVVAGQWYTIPRVPS
jgi:hypothetical protein